MRFCFPQHQNQVVVDHIISGMFRLYLHEPDHVTQSRAHVGDDDWAMPIGLGANRHFIEEDIAQKMVGVQNHVWGSGFIDKNHPFFSRSIQLPQERIAWRALERWQHWPSAHNWQRDDAAGINRLPLVQHGDIVEVEKIQCADRFQSSDILLPASTCFDMRTRKSRSRSHTMLSGPSHQLSNRAVGFATGKSIS